MLGKSAFKMVLRRLLANCSLLLGIYLMFIVSFQYYFTTLVYDLGNVKEEHVNRKYEPNLSIHRQKPTIEEQINHHISTLTKISMLQNITSKNHDFNKEKTIQKNDPGYRKQRFDKFSPNCEVLFFDTEFDIQKTSFPFKIYVYDLPAQLNTETAKCSMQHDPCFDISKCGAGEFLHTDQDLSVHSTWQFALETIIHNKLMLSIHRTHDPEEANLFYVPYYGAMACFCYDRFGQVFTKEIDNNVELLINFLKNSTYFQKGKPHLLTVSKIEREQASQRCPLLRKLNSPNVKYIGIEQESNPGHRAYMKVTAEMIAAPYPSYGHLHVLNTGNYEKALFSKQRNILVFLAASTRRSNTFRAKILDQIKDSKTNVGLKDYLHSKGLQNTSSVDAVWLITPECHGKHKYYTLEYMKNSVFCLQPPGDSPTRKSFYDGLISGCIPVLFKERYEVKWPFQNYIPYENITVTLSPSFVQAGHSIIDELHKISQLQIETMQTLISNYVKYFQYSYPPSNLPHDDALELILREAAEAFQLK